MKGLDPSRLLSLRTVVRAGSISAGARELGWTQQAISQQLRELERQIGQPVLLRTHQGVEPTDAGRVLVAHADAIASHLDTAGTELAQLSHLERGTVRVAAAVTDMMSLIPHAMGLLGGGVDISLVTADPEPTIQLLRDGDVDVAVTYRFPEEPAPDLSSLVVKEIGRQQYCVIAPAGRVDTAKDRVTLTDFADQPWTTGCDYCERHLVTAARNAGFTPRIIQPTSDHLIAMAFVAHGLALSMVPLGVAAVFPDPRVETIFMPELSERITIVVHRPGAERVPSIAATLNALQQAATSDPSYTTPEKQWDAHSVTSAPPPCWIP